jgi:hypothetical protein
LLALLEVCRIMVSASLPAFRQACAAFPFLDCSASGTASRSLLKAVVSNSVRFTAHSRTFVGLSLMAAQGLLLQCHFLHLRVLWMRNSACLTQWREAPRVQTERRQFLIGCMMPASAMGVLDHIEDDMRLFGPAMGHEPARHPHYPLNRTAHSPMLRRTGL